MAARAFLTPARRALAAALLFLVSAALAGVVLTAEAVEYRTFGLTEGLFALFLAYILILRRAWPSPRGWPGWLAVGYGTIASAQVLGLLFPPPGVIEWVVVIGLALLSWGALGGGSRERLVAGLASLALLLALLKFSIIPFLWERAGPAAGTALGLGDVAASVRSFFAARPEITAAGQLVGFIAVAFWALATRLLWPPEPRSPNPEPRAY